MLFRGDDVKGILAGDITLAFRRWKRPTVKAGGTLRVPGGVLAIEAVDIIEPPEVSDRDARRAGRESRESLLAELAKYPDGRLYRIRFRFKGADERVALREQATLSESELKAVLQKLARLDRHGGGTHGRADGGMGGDGAGRRETADGSGAWTRTVLAAIGESPGLRAADLAAALGFEKMWLKTHVRKLKALGLTESLEVGYRLSPRGRKVLAAMDSRRVTK